MNRSIRSTPSSRLGVYAVLCSLLACQPPAGPRQLPSPRIDTHAMFETGRGAGRGTNDGAGAAVSTFEERLREEARRRADRGRDAAVAALEVLRLSGGLVGELPRQSGWHWAIEADLCFAVHEAGGVKDAVLLAQRLDQKGDRRPSAALNRFFLAVDPALASSWITLGSEVTPLAVQLAGDLSLPPAAVRLAVERLQTPTLGRGIGYRSEPERFSGWRWVGTNRHGTFLRFARTEGLWGPQAPLDPVAERLLAILGGSTPELAHLLWAGGATSRREGTAMMVLGTAARQQHHEVDLAMVCRLGPECAVGDDFARFVESLRSPSGLAVAVEPVSSSGSGLQGLAHSAGIELYPNAAALVSESLRRLGEQVARERPSAESETPSSAASESPKDPEIPKVTDDTAEPMQGSSSSSGLAGENL